MQHLWQCINTYSHHIASTEMLLRPQLGQQHFNGLGTLKNRDPPAHGYQCISIISGRFTFMHLLWTCTKFILIISLQLHKQQKTYQSAHSEKGFVFLYVMIHVVHLRCDSYVIKILNVSSDHVRSTHWLIARSTDQLLIVFNSGSLRYTCMTQVYK